MTCSTNTKSNLAAARSRKQNKEAYGILFSDMTNQGWTVDYETLEMGSLGHYQREMRPLLSSALDLLKRPTQDCCAKAATSCSYHIFLARNSPSWSPPPCWHFEWRLNGLTKDVALAASAEACAVEHSRLCLMHGGWSMRSRAVEHACLVPHAWW